MPRLTGEMLADLRARGRPDSPTPVDDRADESINYPAHYTSHPSGIECIQITEHMNFCVGNAIKYLWRAGQKNDAIEDLEKARWYISREIARLQSKSPTE